MSTPTLDGFGGIRGWDGDDHAAALASYEETVDLLGPDWPRAEDTPAREFFETRFRPRIISDDALLTGYYEPELDGSATPSDTFRFPLFAPPLTYEPGQVWHERAEIEDRGFLAGRELIWLDSPLEAFLAQVQGSVRVRLTDGSARRYGFAGKNGHPYNSIGKELVRRGDLTEANCSVEAIRAWANLNPDALPGLLRTNKSFVFFKLIDLPETAGPIGTMQRSVTAMRSLAVDPKHIPLGAPVWVAAGEIRQLMVAQDTGSAILGPARADIFFGTGLAAGKAAGDMRLPGRLVALFPKTEP